MNAKFWRNFPPFGGNNLETKGVTARGEIIMPAFSKA
jgi:hypothetical protein